MSDKQGPAARKPDAPTPGVEPPDESALESMGRAVSETVLGSEAPVPEPPVDAEEAPRAP